MCLDACRNGGLVWISAHAASDRWPARSGQDDRDLREVWWEAEPVDYPDARGPSTITRYHVETDQILLAANGELITSIPLSDRPDDVQKTVHEQLEAES